MNDSSSITSKSIVNANLGRIIKPRTSDVSPTLDAGSDTVTQEISSKPNLITSLVAGAAAGVAVDVSLYPLDTLKTRLQSQYGFKASGGFKGVYKGIGPVLIGSAPISALFFGSYNSIVNFMKSEKNDLSDSFIHFTAAASSEVLGALLRVPLELIKQRKQVSESTGTTLQVLKYTWKVEGVVGLYKGFTSTIIREIPFTAIQFPLWEYFKVKMNTIKNKALTAFEGAICGAVAGGISAAITTPLDVIKTRTMLADKKTLDSYGRYAIYYIVREVLQQHGASGLFAGLVPRVLWITLGGFIYFGMYEVTKNLIENNKETRSNSTDFCSSMINEIKEKKLEKLRISQTAPSYSDFPDWDDFVEEEQNVATHFLPEDCESDERETGQSC